MLLCALGEPSVLQIVSFCPAPLFPSVEGGLLGAPLRLGPCLPPRAALGFAQRAQEAVLLSTPPPTQKVKCLRTVGSCLKVLEGLHTWDTALGGCEHKANRGYLVFSCFKNWGENQNKTY